MAQAPAQQLITQHEDSRRWRNIVRRPGDIVISAPSAAGASFVQHVIAALLWPRGEAPGSPGELSPWIDACATPIEWLVEQLEAQTHRRFLLTHSPGDCTPFDHRCRYLVVYVDGHDQGGWPGQHLASWWPRRHHANVRFVHLTDALDDVAHELARIATFLEIEVDDRDWPMVVDVGARALDRLPPSANAQALERTDDVVSERVSPDAVDWLRLGSRSLGLRPESIGEAAPPIATGPRNPMVGRVKKQTSNSVHAISERRVDQAREDGLFDNLALHGKPIPDIDRHRRPGWWAERFVKTERNKVTALQLEGELRQAMPGLWRLDTEPQVRDRVRELNSRIATYNKVTTLEPMAALDLTETLATWRNLKHRP